MVLGAGDYGAVVVTMVVGTGGEGCDLWCMFVDLCEFCV